MSLGGYLTHLFAADATDEEKHALARFFWRALIVYFIAWSYGIFSSIGWGDGFARADQIDDKINAQVAPLKTDLVLVAERLTAIEKDLKRMLREQMSANLRSLNRDCLVTPPNSAQRERLVQEIDKGQQIYLDREGERYPLYPPCT